MKNISKKVLASLAIIGCIGLAGCATGSNGTTGAGAGGQTGTDTGSYRETVPPIPMDQN